MAVVRLSSTALKMNVNKLTMMMSLRLLVVLIALVIMENPPFASINSTIVIAPIRKNKIPAISEI